ncbi:hypothetical protein ACB092_07G168400 [Castanea dentata]
MAESAVSGVVTRLSDLLLQEAIYLNDVSDKVRELQTELARMQCFLKDADERQNESMLVKHSLLEMKDLAYDAEDVIMTYALTVTSRKGRDIQKVLKRCACILDEGITVHQVGSKIDVTKERISSLKQSFQDYGIRESTIQAGGPSSLNESPRDQRQTFSDLKHDVIGFDEDLNNLLKFLLSEEEGNRVASICGMGGLGKTTLAKMVYNHPKVKQHFPSRAWVYISQQCQRRPVWEEILMHLSPSQKERDEIPKSTDAEIVEKLGKFQKEQKCLVILDDIWNVGTWSKLHEAFPIKDTKSKILLTSRNKQVPLHVDPRGFLYELQCLNKGRSQELLEKIATSWREDSVTKTYMENCGKEMIEYCGGLPLAITVLGGLLATKQTREEWEDVLKHVKSYLHEEQDLKVNKVLALSYNDLPSHLKSCFLYLGHFPEDFEIPTKEVIRMWMGEGFIAQIQHGGRREGTIMEEDVGERYIWELVQRFMVQVGKRGSLGRIKTCRIHDLMRDFCLLKVQEENFLHITNVFSLKQREGLICKVRRLSIIPESGDNSLKEMNFNKYPYLRSILHLLPPYDLTYFKASCFKKLKFVRVLHLENFKNANGKLPKDIGCLIHLRYISLKKSYINKVPSFIGNLRCLETLDLRSDHMRVPNVFKNMEQLKHLYLPYDYWVWPIWAKLELGNLCYLQTLVNVQPLNIQIPTGLKFNSLRVLHVRTNNEVLKVGTNKRGQDAIEILVSCCPHIYKLSLRVFIKNLPHQFSPNIAKLTLHETRLKEDPMATLENLPNLKILRLFYHAFGGKNMVCSNRGFPLLQSLVLSYVSNLREWRVEEGAMPCLCRLKIEGCHRLKTIPDGLRFVTTLQELEIKNMQKSFKDGLDEGGSDFDKVKHVPSRVFQGCDYERYL